MSEIRAGDLVECVNDDPCEHCGSTISVSFGRIYRVESLDPFKRDGIVLPHRIALSLVGVPAMPNHLRGICSARFRKIDKATDEFTRQIRACKPANQDAR